jgi:hypothetical protein
MSNPTFGDIVRAMGRHSSRHSKAETNRVVESVAGTCSLRDIDPSKYQRIIETLDGVEGGDEPEMSDALALIGSDGAIDSAKVYAKFNARGRRDE